MADENIVLRIRKARDAEILRNTRSKEVSKMFWDKLQQSRYPNANILSTQQTEDALLLKNDLDDIQIEEDFIAKLLAISGNSDVFTNEVFKYIYTRYSASAMEFIIDNWTDITKKARQTFRTFKPSSFITFLKKYLKSNADETPIQLKDEIEDDNFDDDAFSEVSQTTRGTVRDPNRNGSTQGSVRGSRRGSMRNFSEYGNSSTVSSLPANISNYLKNLKNNTSSEMKNENEDIAQIPLEEEVVKPKKLSSDEIASTVRNYLKNEGKPKQIPLTYNADDVFVSTVKNVNGTTTSSITNNKFSNLDVWSRSLDNFLRAKEGTPNYTETKEAITNAKQRLKSGIKLAKEKDTILNSYYGYRNIEDDGISGKGLKKKKGKKSRHKTFGSGIASHNIDPKFYVDMKYLNKDKLAVKYKSTQTWVMRPTDLTEPTKKVVMDILLNKLDQKAYDKLNENEKDIIRQFCDLAKIKVCQAYNQEIESLQLKAEVLIGEIKSGNDSKVVKQMLIDAIEMLMKHHGISKIEGLELLNQLKE